MRSRLGSSSAFTLIELLIAVLIIGILAAIAMPAFNKQRAQSKNAEAVTALRSGIQAAEAYNKQQESYAGLTQAKLAQYERSLRTGAVATTDTPGASADPYRLYVGSDGSGTPPTASTVILCSVSRGDTVFCARGQDGRWTYSRAESQAVSAVADSSFTPTGLTDPLPTGPTYIFYDDYSTDTRTDASRYDFVAPAVNDWSTAGGRLTQTALYAWTTNMTFVHAPVANKTVEWGTLNPNWNGTGLLVKRIDLNNYLNAWLRSDSYGLVRCVAGSCSSLVTHYRNRSNVMTHYRVVINGNTVTMAEYAADPLGGATPLDPPLSVTLSGANATTLGAGVAGATGAYSLGTGSLMLDYIRIQ